MSIEIAFKKSTPEQTLDDFGSELNNIIGKHMWVTSMSMQMTYDTPFGFHFIANKDFDIDSVKDLMKKYEDNIFTYVIQ